MVSAVYYLCHLLLRGKEVVIGQIDCVWSRDNSQSLGEMVAVREVQVKHVANFRVLWIIKERQYILGSEIIISSSSTANVGVAGWSELLK